MMPVPASNLPELFAVGCAIGAEHSVGAALEDEVARGRENSTAFDLGKRNAPHLVLLGRIPGEQQAGHRRSRNQLGQERAVVG